MAERQLHQSELSPEPGIADSEMASAVLGILNTEDVPKDDQIEEDLLSDLSSMTMGSPMISPLQDPDLDANNLTVPTVAAVRYTPTLLRQTMLYDIRENKMVTVMSHWLMQGFPHPLSPALSAERKTWFPYPLDVLNTIPLPKQKVLTGNSMHWVAVSTWLMYILAITRRAQNFSAFPPQPQ